MATLIDIHEAGESIYTLGDDGVLRAYVVNQDGTIRGVDAAAALATERNS
jgi:enoyl reductase-like protein